MNSKIVIFFCVVFAVAVLTPVAEADKYHLKTCDDRCDYSYRAGGGSTSQGSCTECCKARGFMEGGCGGWTLKKCQCWKMY